jgi:hypothetical protein
MNVIMKKIKDYYWYITSKNYVATRFNNKQLLLHKIIMDVGREQIVDHIDRNPKNNKRSNLRFATRSQNNTNIKMRTDNNSGVTGVHWDKEKRKWVARINYDNKRVELGYFDKLEDAKIVRLNAEKKYHKEFTPIERR